MKSSVDSIFANILDAMTKITQGTRDFLLSVFSALVAFFMPISPLLFIVIFAVLLDTLFGIIASVKLKKPILSRKLQRVCVKLLVYLPLILLAYPLDVFILNNFTEHTFKITLILTRVTVMIIVGVELFSIDEKVRAFNGDKGIAFYFNRLIKTLRSARSSISSVVENKDSHIE